MFRRLRIFIVVSISTLLVLAALCVGLFRLAVELLPGYKADIVSGVEKAVGRPVALDHIDLRWRGLGPEVVVNRLRLLKSDGSEVALEVDQVKASFNIADLWAGESSLRPASVTVKGLALTLVREADGRIRIQNLDGDGDSFDSEQVLTWLFQEGEVEVEDVQVDWLDMQRPPSPTARPQFVINRAVLAGNGRKQRLQSRVKLPAELGEELQLDVVLSGSPENWSAEFTVEASTVQIAAFPQQLLRNGGQVVGGRLDTELWGTVENGRVTEVEGDWLVQGAQWQSARYSPLKQWPELKGKARWRDDGVAWQLGLNQLENDGEDFGSMRLEFNREALPQQLYFSADELPLRELAAAVVILPNVDDRVITWLNNAQPKGSGFDLVARLGLEGSALVGGTARLRVQDLSWEAADPVPGVSGISGEVVWNGSAATLTLDDEMASQLEDKSLVLDAPWMFREKLTASNAKAAITLRSDSDALTIELKGMALSNADVGLRGEGSIRLSAGLPPYLWANATFDYADITALKYYLPVGAMQRRPQVVRWLDNAFKNGQITGGTVNFDGPLVATALQAGTGSFQANLQLANATLQFQPQWPEVENITANVRFQDSSIMLDASRASLLNLNLTQLEASIPDLYKASVVLSGNFDSSVVEAFEFLRKTPLKKRFGKILANFETTGRAIGRIEKFNLPLKPPFVPTLSGYLDIQNGKLRGPGWGEAVTAITGRLSFTDKSLRGKKFKGKVHGLTVAANVNTKAKGVVLDLSGSISDSWLQSKIGLPAGLAEGRLNWEGELDLSSGEPRWSITSNTKGLAINLPAPLGKSRGDRRSFVVRGDTLADDKIVIQLDYDLWLKSKISWLALDNRWLFDAAVVRLGGETPQLSNAMSGVYVDGAVANVDIEPWLLWLNQRPKGNAAGPSLRELKLSFNQLRYGDVYFSQQNIRWSPESDGWALVLQGESAQGNVRWFDDQLLNIDMQNLTLRNLGQAPESAELQSPPRDLPPIRFNCNRCQFGDMALGSLSFDLRNTQEGLALSELNVSAPQWQVTGSASWERSVYGPRAMLRTTARSSSVDALLAQFGLSGTLDARSATMRSNLSWPGGPGDFELGRLSGDASIEMGAGRIYKVEPGAAKAIGLLSLDMLPQRLAMNFDDVVKPGFAFETVTGEFLLEEGNALTENLVIDGPSAKIQVSGRTGLGSRDYDQKIQVNPKLGTGVTLAGALLGGTGVGAALLVGQELLNRPFDAITGLRYNVTGSWDNPQISSPKIDPGDIRTGPRGRRN